MQDCNISSAAALEIQQSCTKPSICTIQWKSISSPTALSFADIQYNMEKLAHLSKETKIRSKKLPIKFTKSTRGDLVLQSLKKGHAKQHIRLQRFLEVLVIPDVDKIGGRDTSSLFHWYLRLGHGFVITSHCFPWDVITHPCSYFMVRLNHSWSYGMCN